MEDRRRILIDTSILIDYFRKEDKKKSLFFKHSLKYNLAISTITEFEFMSGLNPKNREFLHKIIENLLVLPFDSACAKIAAQIYRNLKKSNKLIGISDIFIGATAISNNLALATSNLEHFNRIKNLNLL